MKMRCRFILMVNIVAGMLFQGFIVNAGESRDYKKPEDVVAWLYRDYSWEAVMDMNWENASLIEQSKKVLTQYFSVELADLILKDRDYVERTHEIGKLDFDPIFASQDPAATKLKISPGSDANHVDVLFQYPGTDEITHLIYKVAKMKSGWRITDIIYKDGVSLSAILQGKP